MTGKLSIDSMTAFCKSKGFVDANSEIYGGLAGFWDFGVNGVELKNNLKNLYWKDFVHKRDDVIGIDGTIITHPTVWEASGHVGGFGDALLECKKCNIRLRADHFIEDELKITVDGMSSKEILILYMLQRVLGQHIVIKRTVEIRIVAGEKYV